jgi:acyl dehydratase
MSDVTPDLVGTALPSQTFRVTRFELVRYAGASGDFNLIHWNERFAKAVGLPDVIAHGMFTMAEAARVVTDWLGDPGRLEEYSVRFTRPVPVPDDDAGSVIEVSGEVTELLDGGRAKVMLTATHEGQKVLGNAWAIVRLP